MQASDGEMIHSRLPFRVPGPDSGARGMEAANPPSMPGGNITAAEPPGGESPETGAWEEGWEREPHQGGEARAPGPQGPGISGGALWGSAP